MASAQPVSTEKVAEPEVEKREPGGVSVALEGNVVDGDRVEGAPFAVESLDGDVHRLFVRCEEEVGAEFGDIAFGVYRDDSGEGIGETGVVR